MTVDDREESFGEARAKAGGETRSPADAKEPPRACEPVTEAEESRRTEVEQVSRLLLTLREAETIARNLKESGTRR
jgi:hypothetical protein